MLGVSELQDVCRLFITPSFFSTETYFSTTLLSDLLPQQYVLTSLLAYVLT